MHSDLVQACKIRMTLTETANYDSSMKAVVSHLSNCIPSNTVIIQDISSPSSIYM